MTIKGPTLRTVPFPLVEGRPVVERAYAYDGVVTAGIVPELPCVIITGRTIDRYEEMLRLFSARMPVFLRPFGARLDMEASARWKSTIISWLEVKWFLECDNEQAAIIQASCPQCDVVLVETRAREV